MVVFSREEGKYIFCVFVPQISAIFITFRKHILPHDIRVCFSSSFIIGFIGSRTSQFLLCRIFPTIRIDLLEELSTLHFLYYMGMLYRGVRLIKVRQFSCFSEGFHIHMTSASDIKKGSPTEPIMRESITNTRARMYTHRDHDIRLYITNSIEQKHSYLASQEIPHT
jgi:hypothetical protein